MSFDKNAQRARAAQMDASAGLAPPKPAPVKKTIKGFDDKDLFIGDTVIHPTTSSNTIYLRKRVITDIRNGKVFMDGSSQGAFAARLIKISR